MGAAGKAAAQSNITAGQGANVVPNYTSSATESRYFSGGQGSLSGPAASKVSGCATGVPNPDPYKRQECEAVNFLAKNPAQRQQFGIGKSDPLLAGAKPILANPAALAGSMDGSYSACSTQTVNQQAQYSTEVCNQYADMAQSTCQRVLKVTVSTAGPSCFPVGGWLNIGSYWSFYGSRLEYFCDPSIGNPISFRTSGGMLDAANPGHASIQIGGNGPILWGGSPYPLGTIWVNSCNDMSCSLTISTNFVNTSAVIAKPGAGAPTATKSWDNQCTTLEARAQ